MSVAVSGSGLTDTSWRPRGYIKLANLQGDRPDIAIYRRFRTLNSLAILSLQAEIHYLEYQFYETVKEDDTSNDLDREPLSSVFQLSRHATEPNSIQRKLLDSIRPKLREYNEMLLQASALQSLSETTDQEVGVLKEWLKHDHGGHKFLQGVERSTWTNHKDLITLRQTRNEHGPIPRWLNPRLTNLYHKCWGRYQEPDDSHDLEKSLVIDYNESKAIKMSRVMAAFIATTIAALYPVIVILVLYEIRTTRVRIYATMGFTVAFGLFLRLFTNASLKEIFAATAAFAAVEVVYIGSANGS